MRKLKLAPKNELHDQKAEYLANATINFIGHVQNAIQLDRPHDIQFFAKDYLKKCDTQSLPKKFLKVAAAVAIAVVVAAAVIGFAALLLTTPVGFFAFLVAPVAYLAVTSGLSLGLGATAGALSGIKFFQHGPRTGSAIEAGEAANKVDLKQGLAI